MKALHGGLGAVTALALLIGCGGGGTSATTSTTGASTTAVGTTSTMGSTTTGTTPTNDGPAAGTYTGTYGSVVFHQGGPGTVGPSGSATLIVASDATFTLTLGDKNADGTLAATGTASRSFTGTFDGVSVSGTVAQVGSGVTVRFSTYDDSSHANGTAYTATVF